MKHRSAPMAMFRTIAFCLALVPCLTAFGHVTVVPVKAFTSATQIYTVRVPSEGGRTTTGLVLTVPKGVTVQSGAVPKDGGSVAFQRKSAGEPDEIVWTLEIKPGAVVQLAFTAANGAEDAKIVWKFVQKYADGTTGEWTPATTLGPVDAELAPEAPAAAAPK